MPSRAGRTQRSSRPARPSASDGEGGVPFSIEQTKWPLALADAAVKIMQSASAVRLPSQRTQPCSCSTTQDRRSVGLP